MGPDIIGPIFFLGGTAAVLWKFFEGRHKERMAMIEKGINPAEFKSATTRLWKGNVLSNLKWGLLFIFVGIGLLVGYQLHAIWDYDRGSALIACMLITGGIALILYYVIAAKKIKDIQ